MLSERINDELTEVDGGLSDLNIRREKLIDGRSRAVAAEGGLKWLDNQSKVKNRDEKESEFNLVLDDLTERLFDDKPKKKVAPKVVDVSNEEKIKEEEPKKKFFSTGE